MGRRQQLWGTGLVLIMSTWLQYRCLVMTSEQPLKTHKADFISDLVADS